MADRIWLNTGKYGVAGQAIGIASMTGEFTSITSAGQGGVAPLMQAAGYGTGIGFYFQGGGGNGTSSGFINMTFPGGSVARLIGGIGFTPTIAANNLIGFLLSDGAGTPQIGVYFNSSGQLVVVSGGNSNGIPQDVVATSSQSVSSGTYHWVEFDITINNSTGAYTVWLDGVETSLAATGVNTRGGSSNNSCSVLTIFGQTNTSAGDSPAQNPSPGSFGDSLYLFDSTGGANNAVFGNGRVELDLMTADSSTGFSIGNGVLGYYFGANEWGTTATTNAPGANELALIPFTPAVSGVLASMGFMPAASSPSANYKPVLYGSNVSGIPDGTALLASGAQVSGAVSGVAVSVPFASGYNLASGTKYWGGFITDTSVILNLAYASSDPLLGRKAANTYTSGVPATAPSMTSGQATWQIWANTSGQPHNYSEVNDLPPPGSLSYVTSAVSGTIDQYDHQALSSNAAVIAGVKVSAYCWDTDAGPRTANFIVNSGGTSGYGSVSGFTPPTTVSWKSSYFDTDPYTAAAWQTSGYNAAVLGPQIVA